VNITVSIDEVTLNTAVAKVMAYDNDEGEMYATGEEVTVGHLVAKQIVERLVKDDRWPHLRDEVLEVRKEEIRAAVRPSIVEALTRPIYQTNRFGERTGTETTLSEMIVAEVQKSLTEPADPYNRQNGTLLQLALRPEVKRVFQEGAKAAVEEMAKVLLSEGISTVVAEQIGAATTAKLTGK
jgi:hypothetical protein